MSTSEGISVRRVVSEIEIKDNPTATPKFLPTREVLRIYTEYLTKCLEQGTAIVPFAKFTAGDR